MQLAEFVEYGETDGGERDFCVAQEHHLIKDEEERPRVALRIVHSPVMPLRAEEERRGHQTHDHDLHSDDPPIYQPVVS